MSHIIVIEGPDRVGKATQCGMLRDKLQSMGHRVSSVEVPIKDAITYPIIYWMLSNGSAKIFPKIFQWMQHLNRSIFQKKILPVLRANNDYVVFDRWSMSTIVYGVAAGLDVNFLEKLRRQLVEPDLTIVLSGPSFSHEPEDSYERDTKLQADVRVLYNGWAYLQKDSTVLVDCVGTPDTVHARIMSHIMDAGLL